jgi:hypothetical protein
LTPPVKKPVFPNGAHGGAAPPRAAMYHPGLRARSGVFSPNVLFAQVIDCPLVIIRGSSCANPEQGGRHLIDTLHVHHGSEPGVAFDSIGQIHEALRHTFRKFTIFFLQTLHLGVVEVLSVQADEQVTWLARRKASTCLTRPFGDPQRSSENIVKVLQVSDERRSLIGARPSAWL